MGEGKSPEMERIINELQVEFGITNSFREASDHPYNCKCDKCLKWWLAIGPDEDENGEPDWGPFTAEEIAEGTPPCDR